MRGKPGKGEVNGRKKAMGLQDAQLHEGRPSRIRPEMVSEKRAFPEISRKWKIIRLWKICPTLPAESHEGFPKKK